MIKTSFLLVQFGIFLSFKQLETNLNNIPNEFNWQTSLLKREVNSENGVYIKIGSGNEMTKHLRSFQINIGYKSVVITNSKSISWGVVCDDSTSLTIDSCSIDDNEEKEETYGKALFKYQSGKIHLNMHKNVNLNVTNDQRVNVKIVSSFSEWTLSNWMVLGLSPKSEFGQYFNSIYQTSFSLMLYFKNFDPYHFNDQSFYNLRAIFNPIIDQKDINGVYTLDKNDEFWAIDGNLTTTTKIWEIKKTKVCFSSISNNLILIKNSENQCDFFRSLVCDGRTGNDCHKEKADLRKAPNITINLENAQYSIPPENYLYFKLNVLKCYFEEFRAEINSECPKDSEFGVGKQFFVNNIPIFHFEVDGTRKVTLVKKHTILDSESNSYVKFVFLILLGIVISMVSVNYLFELKRIKREKANEYLQVNFD